MIEHIEELFILFVKFVTNKKIIIILTSISIITLILSIFLVPYIIINIPENYFVYKKRMLKRGIIFYMVSIFKNFFGLLFIIAGTIMIFTPGQGLLFLFIGFIMLNFPGKYKLEKRLIKNKQINKMINNIRKKHNKPPLIIPE